MTAGLHAQALTFREMEDVPPPKVPGAPLPDVMFGDAAWGDLDEDGDLDVVVTGNRGSIEDPTPISDIFFNEGDITYVDGFGQTHYVTLFEQQFASLEDVWRSAIEVADLDVDGDLDILLVGLNESSEYVTTAYANLGTGRGFSQVASFEGLRSSDLDLGDYDNDGDPDVLRLGLDAGGQPRTEIWENRLRDGGGFVRRNVGLQPLSFGTADWGDYDADGDLDIVVAGHAEPQAFVVNIYRNDGNGMFIDVGGTFNTFLFPSVAWGDYDNDGDLDVLLNGGKLSPFVLEGRARVYRNDDGVFTDTGMLLGGGYAGDAAWGDFTNDGRLDALVMGGTFPVGVSTLRAYANRGGGTFEWVPGLGGRLFGRARWGDYDDDGDLDVLAVGRNADGTGMANEYRNELTIPNTPPEVPSGLGATVEGVSVTFRWQPATDAETPSPGLTYNLRVGTAPRATDVVSPMADAETGYRFVAEPGNAGHATSWTLQGLEPGTYYWSVQAIDPSYEGSSFGADETFGTGDPDDTTPPAVPTGLMARGGDGEVQLNWAPNTEPDLARYLVFRGFEPGPTTRVATLPAGTTTYRDVDVINEATYYYRVQAQDESGNTSAFSDEVSVTPDVPFTDTDLRLTSRRNGDLAWGDYDGDGDLDLVVAGTTTRRNEEIARIYRNDDGDIVDTGLELSTSAISGAGWGDFDGDGDLDLVFGREIDTRIYRNDEGTFNLLHTLPGVAEGSVEGGDYDGDGDLDLVLAGGTNEGQAFTRIYRNDGDGFVEAPAELAGIVSGAATWGDYDGDGDLDLAVAGRSGISQGLAHIYRNENGLFGRVEAGLEQGIGEDAAWADYDVDGDLDLLLGTRQGTFLYRNDDGVFNVTEFDFVLLTNSDAEWGDYDGDGDPDLVIAGRAFYRNDQNAFVPIEVDMNPQASRVDWGDYDADGDLDFILGVSNVRLYRNNRIRSSAASSTNASR